MLSPATASTGAPSTLQSRLAELVAARAANLITAAELTSAKAKVLSSFSVSASPPPIPSTLTATPAAAAVSTVEDPQSKAARELQATVLRLIGTKEKPFLHRDLYEAIYTNCGLGDGLLRDDYSWFVGSTPSRRMATDIFRSAPVGTTPPALLTIDTPGVHPGASALLRFTVRDFLRRILAYFLSYEQAKRAGILYERSDRRKLCDETLKVLQDMDEATCAPGITEIIAKLSSGSSSKSVSALIDRKEKSSERCGFCRSFGHEEKDCRKKTAQQNSKNYKGGNNNNKKPRPEGR